MDIHEVECVLLAGTVQVFTCTTDLYNLLEEKIFPEIIYVQMRKAIVEKELTYRDLKTLHTGKNT